MISYDQQINLQIGAKIKSLRKTSGITQIDLANSMGLSYQQIQKYENGKTKITIERLKQFADIFRIPLETFIKDNVPFDKIFKIKEDTATDASFSFEGLKPDEMSLLKFYRSIKDDRIKEGLLWQLRGIHSNQEKKCK